MSKTTKIRWVIAHEPLNLFLRAAEDFERRVNEQQSEHKIEVEIMTLTEYSQRYNDGVVVTKHDLLDLMEAGKIEMSQMYTTTLGLLDSDMFVLDMPFIFRDHEHAARVLDGEIGQELMNGLAEKTNIKGLAFTYSGGFRAIIGNRVIESVEDMSGMRVRVAHCPVAEDTMRALGAEPIVMPIEQLRDALGSQEVDSGESTYPRIYGMNQNETATVINHTEHSLFLTTIIMNKGLWAQLTLDQQQIFQEAALAAAKVERAESLDDIGITQQRAIQDGIQVNYLTADQQQAFKDATGVVYSKYQDYFNNNLISRIQNS